MATQDRILAQTFYPDPAHIARMVEPVEQQNLIDKLSALVLTGGVDFYQAKRAVEDGDWDLAQELIEGAK